ncbi:MAG: bifunctional UDP-N-acetylglucosamine diphosphorylase/glucosamine-1-phosphate N-acetyltransferase GlmU [Gammaproteobacteria bacterium]|nr:bifunctional UDP-N-acetylglucosamine diphosphorylase/glucosamine-1-phosphate N-acetyltransferase GlmU [Gammaproteobacteria bacterium]
MNIQIVILAAGHGKRMHSSYPKVLHPLAGKPLLEHVIHTALTLAPDASPIIVHGHQGTILQNALSHYPITWVEQKEQLGTGHALLQALPAIHEEDQVLILYGDVPLIKVETLKKLMTNTPQNALGLLTAFFDNPTGYGRIKRNAEQAIIGIVEERDATLVERAIKEINPGIYFLPARFLKKYLPQLKNNNQQKEYYLTDILTFAVQENIPIISTQADCEVEVLGVNDKQQLAQLERFYQLQLAKKLMQQGVTLYDPARLDIRGEVIIGHDVTIDVNVVLEGRVVIGDHCTIGAHTYLRNTSIAHHVEIKPQSIIDGAEIAEHCIIGPMARLRPGTVLAAHTHVGNFVEIKNSEIGERTKINHLSYVGDSVVGREVNIGAGTITCNYDGVNKHKTVIGDRVQIGSDSTLVAPLTIQDDVYIAAATTVRKTVPAGTLVYNAREEKHKKDWVATRKEKIKKK